MSEEILDIAKRLLRRALSTIYISVGFFLVVFWVWEDYIGVSALVIIYLICASILYSHVFKPLVKYRKLSSIMGYNSLNIFKILGFTASAFGLIAIVTTIIKEYYYTIPDYIISLAGLLAVIVSVIALIIAIYGSPKLFGLPEIAAIIILASTIVIYLFRPSLVLPIIGTSFITLGVYTYCIYYLRAKDKDTGG